VIGVVAGLVAGGRLANWAQVDIRGPWVVLAALLVREAVALTPLNRVEELRYAYVLFLAVLLGWTAWHFRRIPAVWLISIGAAMNLVVIAANDFRMPVEAGAAGRLVEVGHAGQYAVMDSATRLGWLGDWIAVAGGFGGVYSPGDVVIGLGTGMVAFLITRRGAPRTKLGATSGRIGS
jgi:hypothetical protein